MMDRVADWEEGLAQRAERCARSITYVTGELIRERFLLGELVVEALERSQYGDAVVVRLAQRMSVAVGKCIRPHMLYESARIHNAFGGKWEWIEVLRAQLSFPLSYSYLVRFCLPALTTDTAWNAQQVTYSNDFELRGFESAVLKIEERIQAHRTRQQPTGQERPAELEIEGFISACAQASDFQAMAVRTLVQRLETLCEILEGKALQEGGEYEALRSSHESILALASKMTNIGRLLEDRMSRGVEVLGNETAPLSSKEI